MSELYIIGARLEAAWDPDYRNKAESDPVYRNKIEEWLQFEQTRPDQPNAEGQIIDPITNKLVDKDEYFEIKRREHFESSSIETIEDPYKNLSEVDLIKELVEVYQSDQNKESSQIALHLIKSNLLDIAYGKSHRITRKFRRKNTYYEEANRAYLEKINLAKRLANESKIMAKPIEAPQDNSSPILNDHPELIYSSSLEKIRVSKIKKINSYIGALISVKSSAVKEKYRGSKHKRRYIIIGAFGLAAAGIAAHYFGIDHGSTHHQAIENINNLPHITADGSGLDVTHLNSTHSTHHGVLHHHINKSMSNHSHGHARMAVYESNDSVLHLNQTHNSIWSNVQENLIKHGYQASDKNTSIVTDWIEHNQGLSDYDTYHLPVGYTIHMPSPAILHQLLLNKA